MNNTYIAAFSLSLFIGISCTDELRNAQQASRIQAALVGAHTRAFGKDNIFKQPFTQSEELAWASAVAAVGDFIRDNGDSDQKSMWLVCVRANNQLLRFVDRTLYGFHMKEKLDPEKVKSMFTAITAQLEQELRQQKKQTYFLQSKILTRDMLEHLAIMLIATMDKALKDAYIAIFNGN